MHKQMEGGQIFHFRGIAQDDVCMWQRNCLGKRLKMRAAAEVLYLVPKKDHGAHTPAKVPTYFSERTAAAAIAGATKDFLLPCGPKFS